MYTYSSNRNSLFIVYILVEFTYTIEIENVWNFKWITQQKLKLETCALSSPVLRHVCLNSNLDVEEFKYI